jgi:hypothetical protein
MKNVLLAVALVASTGQVLAYSGNELLERARSGDRVQASQEIPGDRFSGGAWLGFVRGVTFTLNDIDPTVCLPSGGTVGQFAAVVKQYLEQNPAQLHRPAHVLVREALQRAFPCR